jgi:recombination protein U
MKGGRLLSKKGAGKKFEEDVAKSVPDYMVCHRVRDSFYKGAISIADYIIYNYPNMVFLELKSYKGKSVPFNALNDKQLKKLEVESKKLGVKAGVIFNFRDVGETYYLDVLEVIDYIIEADRKSFPIKWCRENGIKIKQKLKRTRYSYMVGEFWQELINNDRD